METQPILRTNAEKRRLVELTLLQLASEFGSLDQIPKQQWSDRKIADHLGVSNRMVSYIHAELLGKAAPVKISQKADFNELQRTMRFGDDYKAQLEAATEVNRQLRHEVSRLQCGVGVGARPSVTAQACTGATSKRLAD